MARIAGIILSGGESRRFGAPKAEAPLGGMPLINHVQTRLGGQTDSLAVAGSAYGSGLLELDDGPFAGRGPLAGVFAGLSWALEQNILWIITAPCDVPFLPTNLVSLLRAGSTENVPRALQVEDRLQVACALWPTSSRATIENILKDGTRLSLHHAFQHAGGIAIPADASDLEGNFQNINTPDDLTRAEAKIVK